MENLAWPERWALVLLMMESMFVGFFVLTSPYAWTMDWVFACLAAWRLPVFTIGPIWLFFRVMDAIIFPRQKL